MRLKKRAAAVLIGLSLCVGIFPASAVRAEEGTKAPEEEVSDGRMYKGGEESQETGESEVIEVTSVPDDGTDCWQKDENGWRYIDSEGLYVTNQWKKIKGKWYYFDKNGYMERNAYRQGYYLTGSGAWDGKKVTGSMQDDNNWWHYVIGDEEMLEDTWMKIDGKWYYFWKGGFMSDSSFVDGYWIGRNGAMTNFERCHWKKTVHGWKYGNSFWNADTTWQIDGRACRFDENGICFNP